MSTLKVLFNFDKEDPDPNGYSGYTFVSTVMLLVINMFADDLKIPIEYFNKISVSSDVDIYINFNDADGVYENSTVEMIWPHYQNRYCLIHTNTRKTTVNNLLSFTSTCIGFSMLFSCMNLLFFYFILRYRMGKSIEESFGQALSYMSQVDLMLPIPSFDVTTAEKFYLASTFLQAFIKGTIFVCLFTVQLIAPQFQLVSDQQTMIETGISLQPITDFGIGEPCLLELKQDQLITTLGLYLRRGCFLACDIANKTVQSNKGVVLLNEEINFQQIFKISKKSHQFHMIKKLLRRYFEAGILDRTLTNIHVSSHKYLEETPYADEIKLKDLYSVSKEMLIFGFVCSITLLVCEIFYHRYNQARNTIVRGASSSSP